MKNSQDVIRKIAELTTTIEMKYPELYHFIDKDLMTIPATNNPHIDKTVMKDYLENLKQILKQYLETHKRNRL